MFAEVVWRGETFDAALSTKLAKLAKPSGGKAPEELVVFRVVMPKPFSLVCLASEREVIRKYLLDLGIGQYSVHG